MQTPSGMDPRELMLTAARAVAVYILMLIVIRALGNAARGFTTCAVVLVGIHAALSVWRALQDSNLWPSAPEADALSS